MVKEGRGQPAHHKAVSPSHKLENRFDNSSNGRHGHAHSPGKNKDGLSGYHEGPGNVGGPAHKHNKQAGGKHRGTPGGFGGHHKHDHPMAHTEVHHASTHDNSGHKGHLGYNKMLHSHKISERPMGAFRYHEVFNKG